MPISARCSHRCRRLACALCVLLLIVALYAALCATSGVDPAAYIYKTYLLQAQAWLRGEICLDQNYEYLELAVYQGRYYVSFPPVPSIPMVLYALIWGDDVPGGLFQKLYVAIACLVVLSELQRTRRMRPGDCAAWAIFLCFASAMLPISLLGGVWYEAQILAFLFSVSAIATMRRGRCTLSCLLYALSVGCRPFTVVLGPVLLMLHIENMCARGASFRRGIVRLLPGLAVGLLVAAAYGAYNYARFGNPFEFGHNYLPEFTRSDHGQLSLAYVGQNWKTLFFGAPFTTDGATLCLNQFGFSMFISCPILLCNLVWLAKDLIRRRMTPAKWTLLLMGALNTFLLLMHRTLGGHQFGARYALELVPLCFAWLLLSPDRKKLTRWESVLMSFGMLFNFLGACLVHI